jgi:hypothetical protein
MEFAFRHRNSIVNQREVGMDTHSYAAALKEALREAPDVIMIGEVRDRATMEHALAYADTGHLCLTTLHATNAHQALDRVIRFFPSESRDQLLMDLSLNLRAIIDLIGGGLSAPRNKLAVQNALYSLGALLIGSLIVIRFPLLVQTIKTDIHHAANGRVFEHTRRYPSPMACIKKEKPRFICLKWLAIQRNRIN